MLESRGNRSGDSIEAKLQETGFVTYKLNKD